MKSLTAILGMMGTAWLLCSSAAPTPAAPYAQPMDSGIREITVTAVPDGDTITADVDMGDIGGMTCILKGVRLRLKGVSAYEITADPKKQTIQDRETGILEREALAKMLFGSKTVTARIFRHGTYDRHDAILYTSELEVNKAMLEFPQGGR